MESSSGQSSGSYDHSFKILLIGDAGVGKTSLIATFLSDSTQTPQPTVDMDLKSKLLVVGGTKLMLKIWDTPGQDKFRTLTHSFYRDADGIILVYDITDRSTFTAISDFWAKEVGLYTNNPECVKMLVGNKVDRDSERTVSREEGITLAKELGCLFLECSAKTKENVEQCFGTLAVQIMEVPSLEEEEEEEEEDEEESSVELNMGIGLNMDVGGAGRRVGRGHGRSRGRGRGRGHGRGVHGSRGGRVIRGVRGLLVGRGGRC